MHQSVPTTNAAAIALAIALVALVGVSLSLSVPLLSMGMERMGVTGTLNGLNTATAGVANLAVVPFVPALAAAIGVRRLLCAAILLGLVTTLLFPLLAFPFWFPLRFLLGASLGVLFVLSEYWINATAAPSQRGMVMGIYATVLALGFAAGPALLSVVGTLGWTPYVLSAALFGLALLPLGLGRGKVPEFAGDGGKGHNVFSFVRLAPTATIAALVFGAVETGAFSLLPVYGTRTGLDEASAAQLVSILALGNVLFQIPVGWLSDRIDKRLVLLACGTSGALGAAVMPLVAGDPVPFRVGLLIFGGLVGGLYTVGLAHLGQRYTGRDLASANAAFVMLYSAGLILGPPFIGVSMDAFGTSGLAAGLSALLAGYAGLALWRILTSRHS